MEQTPADHKLDVGRKLDDVLTEEQLSSLVKNGTVDYLGRPANKNTTGGWRVAPLIFGGEMCERMSAFGVAYNLVTYLVVNLHLSKPYSANMVTNFIGTAFLTCLIGGFVSDTWLGRYCTIVVFGTIQFLGLVTITLFASLPVFWQPQCDPPRVPCRPAHGMDLATLYIALYLIALGTGGIKSCVSAFGADQFDHHDPLEGKHMAYFFNWFFFFISTGALIAVTLLVYIQDKIGRGWGFGITSSFMLFAVVAFVGGRRVYRYSPPQGSPLTRIARVVVAAFRKRKLELPIDPDTMLYELPPPQRLGLQQQLDELPGFYIDRIAYTDQFLFLSKAAIIEDVDDSARTSDPKTILESTQDTVQNGESKKASWAKSMVTVTQVEEVKILIRVLPILFSTFLFWTVYAQMTTFTVEQAVVMDRKLGKHFEIPPASIAVFLQLSIMTMVVLYDRVFVRVMRSYTGRAQGISTLQRIGVGLVLSFLAMVAAALVEEKRRRTVHSLESKKARMISVFWLLPQYFFVGTGEAFTYIGQLEFFYGESPSSMRSMGTALCLCTMSIGFYTSSFLVDTVDRFSKRDGDYGWLADDLDEGHLDRFYWLLAFLSFLNFFIYLVVARWYNYRPKYCTTELSEHETNYSLERDL